MTLETIRELVARFGVGDSVYMGLLPVKPEKVLGVYNERGAQPYNIAIGGDDNTKHNVKHFTVLIHWNKSPRETEEAANAVFDALRGVSNVTINNDLIYYVMPLHDPVDVGADASGVFEYTITAAAYYEK